MNVKMDCIWIWSSPFLSHDLQQESIMLLLLKTHFQKGGQAMKESFITTHPELLTEWDYEKNGVLGYRPEDFSAGAGKKVWWKCVNGHSWESALYTRTNRHSGCPYCSNNKVLTGYNDLATKYPQVAKEWHPTKNTCSPTEIASTSGKTVWWQCPKGHEWDDTISHRTAEGRNCPICSNRRVLAGYNDLEFTHPQIAKEWNYDKNTLKPTEVTAGSASKVWWKCTDGHEWQTAIAMRTLQNTGCPYCSGKKVLAGYNDLSTTHPELIKEWHPTKNTISPQSISRGTNQKVWWKCEKGHEWEASISNRACQNQGCPICSNKKVLVGYNDFLSQHPDLAKEWNLRMNNGLLPSQITSGHNKPVWWLGKCGHEWKDTIDHRLNRGNGCPICSGQQVLTGYNDLATLVPEIAAEWHPTKNEGILPTKVTKGSNRKVWWLGKCGHEWKCTVVGRVNNNNGCPYCANDLVLKGFNDLESKYPEIAKEWHPTKNGNLLPSQIQYGSGKEVWWRCEKGHEWKIRIVNRTSWKNGCPYCHSQSSFPEQAILFYLKRDLPSEILNRYKVQYRDEKLEIDVYIPSSNIGIEYDGAYWHKNKRLKDDVKTEKLKSLGITVIRVIESNNNAVENGFIYYNCYRNRNKNLAWAITQLERMLELIPKSRICIDKDYPQIADLYRLNEVDNSLATKYPQLALEWHPTKNGELLPTNIYGGSVDKVWWLGKCGHEWQESPNKRTPQKANCPYCSNRRVLKGFNDLLSQYPSVAKELHPIRSLDVKPDETLYSSSKEAWWQCSKGHEWKTSFYHRTVKRTGCPYCAGVKMLKGYNDLATKRPDFAKEWHPTKNALSPSDYTCSSCEKVWWQCELGHEWQAAIVYRIRHNQPCPICAKK